MQILVLGPLAVVADGTEANLGGPKPKALLAALLQHAGTVVATDAIIDLIWDGAPPQSATALVHTYVSLLRRGLASAGGAEALVTRAPGYALRVGQDDSDLGGFERLLGAARAAERRDDPAAAGQAYAEALALWRGPAFGGVEAGFAERWRASLADDRLSAEDGLARSLLATGRADEAAARLGRLVAAHPLREDARALLMRALHESGRQADALEVYRVGRRTLLDELGIEPGERLRALHAAILDGSRAGPTPAPLAPRAVPRMLPPDIGDFTGRAEPLAAVLALATATGGTAPPTAVVSGFGGAGKSALAVHAAHLLRRRYPDGQLFADLRGAERDLDAFEVLGRFLTALGEADPPAALDERVERYRQLVAGRRLVVVLDNARGEHQVRPLLPGAPECLVLVTSRSRLSGLGAGTSIELDFLDAGSAVEMLGKIVGPERVAAAPDAAARIAALCGGVPLAIRAAGAKLAARPHWPLKSLVDRLSDERRRLDELSVGDLAIRSSLALNHTDLDPRARRAFHLLCLLDLPDFGWWVAAPLLGVDPADAEDVVELLVEARLLDVAGVDGIGRVRYRFHDLVQLYGAEQAAGEPREVVDAALTRLLCAWIALVDAGARKLPRMTIGLRPPLADAASAPVDPRLVAEVEENPAEWLKSETAAVVRSVERGHDLGIDGVTTLLITSLLSSPFAVRNEFDGWQRTHEVALTAARAGGDRRGEAMVLAGLGELHYEKDEFAAAEAHFRLAHERATAVGDDPVTAVALVGLGTVARDLGDFASARADLSAAAAIGGDGVVAAARYGLGAIERDHGDLAASAEHFAAATELYRTSGDRRGEALALRGLSLCHRAGGEYAPAAALSADAAAILLAAGDDLGATYAHQSWAKASLRLGVADGVAEALAGCLEVCTRRRDRFGAALMTRTLGEYHLATGDRPAARDLLADALDRWSELDLGIWQARTLRDLAAADPDSADKHWLRATELFAATPTRELAELAATSPAGWRAAVRAPYA